jgi:hypothetical protein
MAGILSSSIRIGFDGLCGIARSRSHLQQLFNGRNGLRTTASSPSPQLQQFVRCFCSSSSSSSSSSSTSSNIGEVTSTSPIVKPQQQKKKGLKKQSNNQESAKETHGSSAEQAVRTPLPSFFLLPSSSS